MFNWFRKTAELDTLKDKLEQFEDRINELERIIKYSSTIDDAVTYHLKKYHTPYDIYIYMFCGIGIKYTLFIYYKRTEYSIPLVELNDMSIIKGSESFLSGVCESDEYVRFRVWTYPYIDDPAVAVEHTFIINYKTGKYTHDCKSIRRSNETTIN